MSGDVFGANAWWLISLLCMLAVSILFLVAEVVASRQLTAKQKLAWIAALLLGTFFTAVIYFAQGKTGRLGRAASVLMAAAIALALGIILVRTATLL